MNIALFKFTLAALLLVWPAAVTSPHYPGPKPDAFAMTQETPDAEVMVYCYGNIVNGIATERRVCRIAREVAAVVKEHAVVDELTGQDRLPFTGPAASQATVLALLEIARHESGFRSKVEDCRITGDMPAKWSKITEGRAISMFQLQSNNYEDLFETGGVKPGTRIPRPKRYSRDAICKSNDLAARLALHALMRQAMTARGSTKPTGVRGMFFTYSGGSGKASKAGREHIEEWARMMRDNGIVLVPKNGAMWVEQKP